LVNTGWCGKESNPTIAFVASLREGEGDAISQVHGPHARPMITSRVLGGESTSYTVP
jgi:hypothetical protein